ncbi:MAG: APC family permease [Alphaproteobacteria bacterium]|nr:APC family permease [Alphaproteobacteria bacterium]
MSDTSGGIEAFGYKQELKRSLSLFDLLVYGLVFIVPGAPIAVFGIVFNASHGMVPLVYLVGLVAMLFTALSYMSMARAIPVAGSVYAYAGQGLGSFAGYIAGWAILLDYLLLPALNYVASAIALHATLPIVPAWAFVVVLLAIATVVNALGIETTARANFVMLGLQMTLMVITMSVTFWALAKGINGAHFSIRPFYQPAALTPSLIFGALSLAVLSFLGFDAISTLSEEAREGSHAVARATMWSLVLAAFLFVLQTYFLSLFALDKSSFAPGDPTNAASYDIATAIGGYWLKFLMTVPGTLFAGLTGALTAQAATARLLYSMARDGKLPRALAHVGERKVPDRAIFLVAAVTLGLGTFLVDKLELLTSMVSFGALVGFLLLHVSVVAYFIVRQKSRNWWRHLIVPLIGLAIIGYVLLNAERNAQIAGVLWLIAGLALYATLRFMGRSTALPDAT